MPKLVRDLAAELGVTPRRVRALAEAKRITDADGRPIVKTHSLWVFPDAYRVLSANRGPAATWVDDQEE